MARTRAFIPELPVQPPAGGPSASLLPGAARGQMGRGVYESIRTAILDCTFLPGMALSEQAVFPALDVGKSLSRVMADIADADHMRAAARFRQLWSTYEDNRDLVLMGAYVPGSDAVLDEAIARRGEMLDYLRQSQHQNVALSTARAQLVEAFL